MEAKDKNSIDFVARHYRHGAFSVSEGRRALGLGRRWSRRALNIAASVAVVVALTATAAVIISRHDYDSKPAKETSPTMQTAPETRVAPERVVRVIEFDDAPLTDVVARITEVYGVAINGLTDESGTKRLTLRFEGNAEDLVASINELLGTELVIAE